MTGWSSLNRLEIGWPGPAASSWSRPNSICRSPCICARLAARRFNQANALAQAISARCGVPVDPFVLTRVKPTLPQGGLSRVQRALNLQGAFEMAEGMAGRIEG